MSYRHGNTYAAHSQFQAAAANYDNASPYDEAAEAADEQLSDLWGDASDNIRAELMAEWIEAKRSRDDEFFDFLRGNRQRIEGAGRAGDVAMAVKLIRKSLPWIKASESVHVDLSRAIQLLDGAA